MTSPVTETSAAACAIAADHFARRLSFETDCADVNAAMRAQARDFVLLDVRARNAYTDAHVPGALTLPWREINRERMAVWPDDALFVVYCAGPHCNAADKAALRLAQLERPVKIMIGGVTGWADEGFAFASGPEAGSLATAA